jgi:hypothetical protein
MKGDEKRNQMKERGKRLQTEKRKKGATREERKALIVSIFRSVLRQILCRRKIGRWIKKEEKSDTKENYMKENTIRQLRVIEGR